MSKFDDLISRCTDFTNLKERIKCSIYVSSKSNNAAFLVPNTIAQLKASSKLEDCRLWSTAYSSVQLHVKWSCIMYEVLQSIAIDDSNQLPNF